MEFDRCCGGGKNLQKVPVNLLENQKGITV
jgi:hypothetical protein